MKDEQKKIIIFGAGAIGTKVSNLLGKESVLCFVDNFGEGELNDIPLIKFDNIFSYYPAGKVIVASYNHYPEMCAQLEDAGITDYLVWRPSFDRYFDDIIMYENGGHKYGYTYLDGILFRFPLYPTIIQLVEAKKEAIGVYSYNGIEDLFIFLLYAYGIADRVKYIFRTKKQNCFKVPEEIENLPTYKSFDKEYENFMNAKGDMDALLIAVERRDIDLCSMKELFSGDYDTFDIFDTTHYISPNPAIQKYKNTYKGKRCFIIGNGPSLRKEDLDTLHLNNEICFGVNKIHLIFDKTKWRPDFLAVSDTRYMGLCKSELLNLDIPVKFVVNCPESMTTEEGIILFNCTAENTYPNYPRFSEHPDRTVFKAGSVVYDICLQMAVYMGFTEIYLLGVDNNLNSYANILNSQHFDKNYHTGEEAIQFKRFSSLYELTDLAYEQAEWHSRKKGYRIFNATRGGRLEAFERVDFDSLFSKENCENP